MSFPILFPLTFISAAFVPVQSMPSWLQGFATYQPVSVTVSACRALMVGAQVTGAVDVVLDVAVAVLVVRLPHRPHPPGHPPVPHPHLSPR